MGTQAAAPPAPPPSLRDRVMAKLPPPVVASLPAPAKTPRRRWIRRILILSPFVGALLCLCWPALSWAAPISLTVDDDGGGGISTSLQLLALMTVLTLAPSILIMMTSFTRIVIVLGFVRNALGTPTMPPNQVLVGLSLFLSLFVMSPTLGAINENALQPLLDEKPGFTEQKALEEAEKPIREFMFRQVDEGDLRLFLELRKMPTENLTQGDVPTTVLIPAFVLSELKTAFEIGFLIFIPFLVIDMVIASTLMSMGMVMLPPVIISLPFKILLFVLVDGWHLITESVVRGFF